MALSLTPANSAHGVMGRLATTCLVNSASQLEEPPHFISTCPLLETKHRELLRHAPPQLQDREPELPEPARDSDLFAHVMLGINWVEDFKLQMFCVNFLAELKAFRANLIRNL